MRRTRIKAVLNVPARRNTGNRTEKSGSDLLDETEKNKATSNDNNDKKVSIETISSIRRNINTETEKPVRDDVSSSNFVKLDENENTSVVHPCSSECRPRTRSMSRCSNIQQIQKQQQPIIKRKARRSDIAEAKRDFYNKFRTRTPDRKELTMKDLIYYNPTSNPMLKQTSTSSKASKTKSVQIDSDSSSSVDSSDNDSIFSKSTLVEEENVDDSEKENIQLEPQVRIGENGEVVLDEQSVVIETTDQKKQRMNKSHELSETAINYDELDTKYGSYKRGKRKGDWSVYETKKFYRVLQMIGTNFSMMSTYFKNRTRRDIKNKFKKEEKINPQLIDKALLNPCTFDLEQLQKSLDRDKQLFDEEQLNKKKMEEIKRQERMQRKPKTNEKRVRYKTGSFLARQIYASKSDMIQDFDEDDPLLTVVPSTSTAEADSQLDPPPIMAPSIGISNTTSTAEVVSQLDHPPTLVPSIMVSNATSTAEVVSQLEHPPTLVPSIMVSNATSTAEVVSQLEHPPTLVPSIMVSNATSTAEVDSQLVNHNPIDSNPTTEVSNQNLEENNPKTDERPLKKFNSSYEDESEKESEEESEDESEDDETKKLLRVMFF